MYNRVIKAGQPPEGSKTMTTKQITVWPEDGNTWIVSRDDESSDTLAVFDNEAEAMDKGREIADAEGLPLYRQDEHGNREEVEAEPEPQRIVEICTRMSDGRLEWSGTGTLDEYGNIECSADIPDAVYSSIDSDIAAGKTEGEIEADGEEYSWIVKADDRV